MNTHYDPLFLVIVLILGTMILGTMIAVCFCKAAQNGDRLMEDRFKER